MFIFKSFVKLLIVAILLVVYLQVHAQDYFRLNDIEPQVFNLSTAADDAINCSKVIRIKAYTALETKNNLISEVDNLFVYNNKFIVFDWRSRSVMIFDKQGKLLKNISNKGKGPNELISVRNIAIDSENGNILIPDRYKRILYTYNIDGELLNKTKTKISFTSFVKHGNGYIVGTRNDTYARGKNTREVYYVNHLAFKPIDGFFKASNYKGRFYPFDVSYRHNIYTFNDNVHYLPLFKYKMFAIDKNGKITPKYFFDFGEQKFYPALFHKTEDIVEFVEKVLPQKNVVLILDVHETNDHIYLSAHSFYKEERIFPYLINKKNGQILINGNVQDDIGSGLRRTVYSKGNSFYSVLSAYQVVSNKKLKEKIEKITNTKIDIYSNPIIVEYEVQ